jgi:hypothetical protein
VRAAHQGRRPAGRRGAGAVRAAGRRDHRVPVRRAVLVQTAHHQALAELFGIPLSSGTVAGITARAAGRLAGFLERARRQIAASEVAGSGETGFRVQSRLHWVHCARTGKYTLLTVHLKRGTEAMKAMGVLPSFAGVAIHDAWAPYDTYTGPEHQLCCAHALRELQAVTDAAPAFLRNCSANLQMTSGRSPRSPVSLSGHAEFTSRCFPITSPNGSNHTLPDSGSVMRMISSWFLTRPACGSLTAAHSNARLISG